MTPSRVLNSVFLLFWVHTIDLCTAVSSPLTSRNCRRIWALTSVSWATFEGEWRKLCHLSTRALVLKEKTSNLTKNENKKEKLKTSKMSDIFTCYSIYRRKRILFNWLTKIIFYPLFSIIRRSGMWIFQINKFYLLKYQKCFPKDFLKHTHAHRKGKMQYTKLFSPNHLRLSCWFDAPSRFPTKQGHCQTQKSGNLESWSPDSSFANCSNMSFTTNGSRSELYIALHTVYCCHASSFFQSGTVPQIFLDFNDG